MRARAVGTSALLLLLVRAAPAAAQTAPPAPDSVTQLTYPLAFDTLQAYLLQLAPPGSAGQVRGLTLSRDSAGGGLRAAGEVRIGSLPGFELFMGLGWARLAATGPVRVLRPGLIGWEVQSFELGGAEILPSLWAPLVRRLTRRDDTVVPFPVGRWITRVEVADDHLLLHADSAAAR